MAREGPRAGAGSALVLPGGLLMTAVQITGKDGFVVLVLTAVMLFAPIIIAMMTAMPPRSESTEKALQSSG